MLHSVCDGSPPIASLAEVTLFAGGQRVQQLVVNVPALRQAWESKECCTQSVTIPHQTQVLPKFPNYCNSYRSTSVCRGPGSAAAGGQRASAAAGLGEQPAQHQGGLGGVDAPLCCGAAEGVPQPRPQGHPLPCTGETLHRPQLMWLSGTDGTGYLQHP